MLGVVVGGCLHMDGVDQVSKYIEGDGIPGSHCQRRELYVLHILKCAFLINLYVN